MDAKRLGQFEDENSSCERLLADAMLDNEMLKESLRKNGKPAVKREPSIRFVWRLGVSDRRACSALGVDRTSVRYPALGPDAADRLPRTTDQRDVSDAGTLRLPACPCPAAP